MGAHHAGVRVPEQPTHPRPTTRRPGQRLDDRRPAVGEELIAIPPPPHEVDRVTVTRRGQHARQGVVVHTSVHQRADRVALGPRPEAGRPIATLELREEPVPDRALTGLPDPEGRSHQRQELLAVRCPDRRRTDTPRAGEGSSTVERSTSNTCRNPITATRSGRRHAKSTNTCGSCPPSSPRSTHRTSGIRSARCSIPASLRARCPRRPIAARSCGQSSPACPTDNRRVPSSARDRPSQHLREGRQVDHRRATQISREGADKAGHGQHRTTIAKTGRAQRPKPAQQTTQRPPPEHTIHIENHAMGIAARHHQDSSRNPVNL